MVVFGQEFGPSQGWGWGLDVDQTDKEIVVRADVPGFEENELGSEGAAPRCRPPRGRQTTRHAPL
jgi:hypothetical protein